METFHTKRIIRHFPTTRLELTLKNCINQNTSVTRHQIEMVMFRVRAFFKCTYFHIFCIIYFGIFFQLVRRKPLRFPSLVAISFCPNFIFFLYFSFILWYPARLATYADSEKFDVKVLEYFTTDKKIIIKK